MNRTDPPTRPSRSKAVLRAPWVLWVVLLILVLAVVAALLLCVVIVTPVPAGYYTSPGWRRDYPRLQILTVEGLLAGPAGPAGAGIGVGVGKTGNDAAVPSVTSPVKTNNSSMGFLNKPGGL